MPTRTASRPSRFEIDDEGHRPAGGALWQPWPVPGRRRSRRRRASLAAVRQQARLSLSVPAGAATGSAAVRMGHLALKRAIRFAARDLVGRNVAELCETPAGQEGRPSRSFTLGQVAGLLGVSEGTRIGTYRAVSLGTGIRPEEARALCWDAVDFGDPRATPPRPPSLAVWRSVRRSGDTRTFRSRRTLRQPVFAADALRDLRVSSCAAEQRPSR
jgi:integrase